MPGDLPNINDLEVFLVACETKNFTQAGRLLHLSQPAISQIINNLERHFDTRLFIRQGRSIYLTEIGQALRPMAQELVTAARRMDESIVSLQGELVGEFEFGCSTAAGKYLLPNPIARFKQLHPMVRINLVAASRSEVNGMLISGEIAMGISSWEFAHRQLEFVELFRDEVILIVPAGHPWADYQRIYPDDLLDEAMLLREETSGTLEVLKKCLLEHDITMDMLKIAMRLENAEALEIAVEEGIGAAFISRLAAVRGLESGRVIEVKVEGLDLFRKIYLARNLKLPPSRAMNEFWDFVLNPESEHIKLENKLLPNLVEN